MKKIKFNIPYFNKSFTDNFNVLYKNKQLSGNNFYSKKCENILRKKYKFNNVFLTDSCSSSFEIIATRLRDLKKKEIIIPSYSYPTVASSFIKNGFKVILVDNQKNSPFIEKSDLEKKINKNISCLVIIHHYGYYEDIKYFQKLKKKYKLILIEDAAQSINLRYKSRFIGNFGDFSAISFHETKNIHCGLGGCLIVNNKKFLKKVKYIWNRGTNRSEITTKNKTYSWHEIGSNYYPSELQSAILFNQLKKIKNIFKIREKIFLNYKNELKNVINPFFQIIIYNKSNFHSIYLLCKNGKVRNNLKNFLSSKNIESTSHYEPLHASKFALKNKKRIIAKNCNNAGNFSKKILRLPMHNYLKLSDIKRIINNLKIFQNKLK